MSEVLVIDNGSGSTKAGFAGADCPKLIFPTVVGIPKEGASALKIGNDAISNRDALSIRRVVDNGGYSVKWNDMGAVWEYTWDELEVKPEEHKILLTYPPMNPKHNTEKMVEIIVEQFNVLAVHVAIPAVLSTYALGLEQALVVDSGYESTFIVPVFQNHEDPYAIRKFDLAGKAVTESLSELLTERGYSLEDEMTVAQNIKEKLSHVAFNFEEEMKASYLPSYQEKTFELPDGNSLSIGNEAFKSAEVLFKPHLVGLEYQGMHEVIQKSILKTDPDIRKNFWKSIVLVGGNTMLPGMQERLTRELSSVDPSDVNVSITAPPARAYSAWVGGSVLASMSSTQWLTKEDYDEEGPTGIHRRCY